MPPPLKSPATPEIPQKGLDLGGALPGTKLVKPVRPEPITPPVLSPGIELVIVIPPPFPCAARAVVGGGVVRRLTITTRSRKALRGRLSFWTPPTIATPRAGLRPFSFSVGGLLRRFLNTILIWVTETPPGF